MLGSTRCSRSWIRFVLFTVLAVCLSTPSSVTGSTVEFTSARAGIRIPFRLYNNHIYLQVAVNGSSPLWFVLDTGAPNIIASKHAKALGLQLTPAPPAMGSGERTQDAFTADNVSLSLPGTTLGRQKLGVINFEELEACSNEIDVDARGSMTKRQRPRTGDERQPFDGVLGDQFFRMFVVELDFDEQVMTLHDPKDYKYTGLGESISVEVRPRFIYLHTQLASSNGANSAGLFLIDTGFMGALLLHKPFIQKNALLPPDNETVPFELCGIGGGSMSRMGEAKSLQLGKVAIKSPVTLFSQAADGNLVSTEYDGVIGNAMLRRFKVVFDYSRSTMILEPRR